MRFLFIFILGVSLTLSIAIWKNKNPVPPPLSQNSREEIVERISLPPTYEDVMKLIENEKNREISVIQTVWQNSYKTFHYSIKCLQLIIWLYFTPNLLKPNRKLLKMICFKNGLNLWDKINFHSRYMNESNQKYTQV